jgi:MYXO-CTERM domain-containing protein
MMRTYIGALTLAAWSALGARAGAHAPLRVIAPLAAEGGTEPALLRTNRGLVFIAGESAAHLCQAALGAHPSELLPAVAAPGGGWVVATSQGIALVSAGGCERPERSSLTGAAVQDLAAHPSVPGALYAVTADVAAGSGLYASEDAGLSFEPVLTLDSGEYLSSLEVSPAEPSRIYLTGSSLDAESGGISHWVLVHSLVGDPDVAEPVRRSIDLTDTERQATLAQVHPTNPDLFALHVRSSQVGQAASDRVLLSRDGGASFETWHAAPGIEQLAFSPDGRSAWLTSADGLHRSEDLGPFVAVPRERGASSVTWLTEQLYVGDATGLFVSNDDGQSFEPLFHFWDVLEPAMCSPAAVQACSQDWEDLSRELELTKQTIELTTPDVAPEEAELLEPSQAAAGCSVAAPQTSNSNGVVLPLLAVLVFALRRRGSAHALVLPGNQPEE